MLLLLRVYSRHLRPYVKDVAVCVSPATAHHITVYALPSYGRLCESFLAKCNAFAKTTLPNKIPNNNNKSSLLHFQVYQP